MNWNSINWWFRYWSCIAIYLFYLNCKVAAVWMCIGTFWLHFNIHYGGHQKNFVCHKYTIRNTLLQEKKKTKRNFLFWISKELIWHKLRSNDTKQKIGRTIREKKNMPKKMKISIAIEIDVPTISSTYWLYKLSSYFVLLLFKYLQNSFIQPLACYFQLLLLLLLFFFWFREEWSDTWQEYNLFHIAAAAVNKHLFAFHWYTHYRP